MEATTGKKWLKSKTVWGILIAFVGWIAQSKLQAPIDVPQNADFDQLKSYAEAIKAAHGSMTVIIAQVTSLVGYLIAIYGRIVAKEKIAL